MLKFRDRYESREVRVAVLSMSGYGYTESQLISQSEETMRPQLMCYALSNPSSSQFRTEVGMSGDKCPKGQDLRGTQSLERISVQRISSREPSGFDSQGKLRVRVGTKSG